MMDEEIRQALSEVQEMKKMCGNINMKLTNIVTQRGQNWKEKLEVEYQRGLDDAWEAAKKIADMWTRIGNTELLAIFGITERIGNSTIRSLFEKQTANEAMLELEAYEEKQKAEDEIKVGDEVEVLNSGSKYLIAWIAGTSICGFAHDGVTCHLQPSDVRKTGRHFDIDKILEEMRT